MKKIIWIIIILLIIWGIVALVGSENNTQISGESIKIGGAFGLTGFASTWGEADRNGAILSIEEINKKGGIDGREVKLLIEDTRSDNTKTLSAVSKLIDIDKVDVIIGPTWMDSFGSASPVAGEKNIVMISPSAAITAIKSKENYKNVFSTWYRSDIQLQKLPSFLKEKGATKLSIIISNDSFWSDAIDNLKSTIEENGIKIVDEQRVNPTETDLRTNIIKIRQSNPDIVFFGFSTEQNLAAFLKQRQEIYPESRLFTTESVEEFLSKDEFKDLLVGVRFIAPKVLESDFHDKYVDRFGVEPIFSASNSYDATNIILNAIDSVGLDTGSINNYLLKESFNTTTFGRINFDEIGGVVGGSFVIKEATSNGVKVIKESF